MPGKKRILIVAIAWSSHTKSWIELINKDLFTARVFNFDFGEGSSGELSKSSKIYFIYQIYRYLKTFQLWIVLKLWRPQIVHSLGLFPASVAVLRLRKSMQKKTKWVVTARGGPELALWRLIAEYKGHITRILGNCDYFMADNKLNYQFALDLGLSSEKIAKTGVIPGSGGIDIADLKSLRKTPAFHSRIIVFPKAYECPASKAMPVLEALTLCWEEIKPCKVYFTAVTPEIRLWIHTLPDEIRESLILFDRIDKLELFNLFSMARLVLMPSLTDGIPNTLYETMACGAVPLVSPINTLTDTFKENWNVIYARNLYPEEIAFEIKRAMKDDDLANQLILNNYALVSEMADKLIISDKLNSFYKSI